jgi:hypothetical protein
MSRRRVFPDLAGRFFRSKLAALKARGSRMPEDPSNDDSIEVENSSDCFVPMSGVYHDDGHRSGYEEGRDMMPRHA